MPGGKDIDVKHVDALESVVMEDGLVCVLMIDDSGYGAMLVIHSLPAQVVQSFHAGSSCSQYETCLFAVYQYLQATASLICDQDTFLADILHREQTYMHEDVDLTTAHRVTQFLALFARCNTRSIEWLTQARGLVQASLLDEPKSASLQQTLDTPCLASGKIIFDDAHDLLRLVAGICASPSLTAIDPREFSSFLAAFCHCAIISIARLFIDPLWTCVGKPPAFDETPHLESRALAGLAILERQLLFISAESLFYLPLLLAISLEIRHPEDKRRVMEVLDVVASKGFVVARTYKSDIQLAWGLSESEFASPDLKM
ncbi:hypothetical protein B0T10DRAFT_581515 [Thelonectria olida]|uniref:Uncharacterized protein n=1 Tax=Thelonectria olida TaxID=1576542 RepID=A0A9P9AKI3_9HYPO|nr:hypothetical protein B0T10DRAFT_581515 [Thelonectria olida]